MLNQTAHFSFKKKKEFFLLSLGLDVVKAGEEGVTLRNSTAPLEVSSSTTALRRASFLSSSASLTSSPVEMIRDCVDTWHWEAPRGLRRKLVGQLVVFVFVSCSCLF